MVKNTPFVTTFRPSVEFIFFRNYHFLPLQANLKINSIMETKNTSRTYVAPTLGLLDIQIERGFGDSIPSDTEGGYPGGETEEM